MKLNCAGRLIEELSIHFNLLVTEYPKSCYEKYTNLQEFKDCLTEMGLVVRSSESGYAASFWFSELFKYNVIMVIAYNSINGDNSKHICRVEAMRKDNSVKLTDHEDFLPLSAFETICTTFISNKSFDNVVEFIKQ